MALQFREKAMVVFRARS